MRRWIPCLIAASALWPSVATAGDASWLWCKGVLTLADGSKTYLGASLVERRAGDGQHRDLDVRLVRPQRAWTAVLRGAKGDFAQQPVALKVTQGKRAIFAGTARLTFTAGTPVTLALDGKVDALWGEGKARPTAATGTLTCDELDDLAIGH